MLQWNVYLYKMIPTLAGAIHRSGKTFYSFRRCIQKKIETKYGDGKEKLIFFMGVRQKKIFQFIIQKVVEHRRVAFIHRCWLKSAYCMMFVFHYQTKKKYYRTETCPHIPFIYWSIERLEATLTTYIFGVSEKRFLSPKHVHVYDCLYIHSI